MGIDEVEACDKPAIGGGAGASGGLEKGIDWSLDEAASSPLQVMVDEVPLCS